MHLRSFCGNCLNVLTSYPTDRLWHVAVREPENVEWPDIYLLLLFSLSPRVSHSGKGWLCSQDAQLPHGGLFIVGWRRCFTSAPGRTLSRDASAQLPDNRGCCCQGNRIMLTSQDLKGSCVKPNLQCAHDLTSLVAWKTLSASCCVF